MPGIHLHVARDVETLAAALSEVVAKPLSSPLARDALVVGCAGMDRWVVQQVARRRGIWVPAWTATPRALIARLIALAYSNEDVVAASIESAAWSIAMSIDSHLASPAFGDVSRYLANDADGSMRLALARHVAALYEKYAFHRPELLDRADGEHAWQSIVFADLRERLGPRALDARLRDLVVRIADLPASLPERISVFGVTTLPTRVLDVLEALSKRVEVHAFVPRVSSSDAPRHALLAGLCAQAVAGTRAIEERAAHIDHIPGARAFEGHALAQLQRELHEDVPRGPTAPPQTRIELARNDRTIEVYACHSPMREAETVRDRLLRAFADDPTLRPRDVAILTPDLDTYAPFIEAAFATPEAENIPPRIADGGGRRRTTGGGALLDALTILRGRSEASAIVELCAHPTVRARHKLKEEDVETIAAWASELAVHWGADADHRSSLGYVDDVREQPLAPENTWRTALDRLVLGVALPGNDERIVFDVLPFDDVEGDRAVLAGRLAELVDGLMSLRGELSGARTLVEWRTIIERILDHLLPSEGRLAFERASLLRRISPLWDGASTVGYETVVSFEALHPWLEAIADDDGIGVGFTSGPITAAALLPMRQVPFRIIAVVGMGEDAFPRRTAVDPLDRALADPRPLDPSSRDEDRGAFLDVLVAARDRLLITYPGKDPQENTPRPPSVVVSELIDALDATFDTKTDARASEWIVSAAPLAPWDARLFKPGEPLQTSSSLFTAGAKASLGTTQPPPPFADALLSDEPLETIEVANLARTLGCPMKTFLQQRLQLDLSDHASELEDVDPHAIDKLTEWKLRDRFFRGCEVGRDRERTRAALRATGLLPPGALGEACLDLAEREAVSLFESARGARGGERKPAQVIDVAVGGARLIGAIDCLYPNGRVINRTGSMRFEHQTELWVNHLAMIVATGDLELRSAIVYLAGGKIRRAAEWHLGAPRGADGKASLDVAKALLADLVQLYRVARTAPLMVFEKGTLKAAQAWIGAQSAGRSVADCASDARTAFRRALEGKWEITGDAFAKRVLRGGEPWEPGFVVPMNAPQLPDAVELARRLAVPMLRAEVG